MPSILFFVSLAGAARNDNRTRLPRAFESQGWAVDVHDHHALRVNAGRLFAGERALESYDLIWLVGLGVRDTFLDRMQLLGTLDPCRFVTSPRALLEWHAKYHLMLGPFAAFHPESYASTDARWLAERIAAGGKWVAKPPAGSFGQDVYVVTCTDTNLNVILDSLTGHDGSRFCLLQRFVEGISGGEKRILLANGDVIGGYLRRPMSDHRANLANDGAAERTELTADETALATRIGAHLSAHGARFAAIDVVYPYVIEYNIANPGGLETLERLTGDDPTRRVVAALRPIPSVG